METPQSTLSSFYSLLQFSVLFDSNSLEVSPFGSPLCHSQTPPLHNERQSPVQGRFSPDNNDWQETFIHC